MQSTAREIYTAQRALQSREDRSASLRNIQRCFGQTAEPREDLKDIGWWVVVVLKCGRSFGSIWCKK